MSVVSEFGPVHKITSERFQRMVEAGIFSENERVELLEGVIVERSPMSPRHAEAIRRVQHYLSRASNTRYLVNNQLPLEADDLSLPEPDVVVTRLREFGDRHPTGSDVLLAVEASLSSIAIDRRKSNIYARTGVPEYWLVDIERRKIEVYTDPAEDGYRLIRIVDEASELSPGFAPECPIYVFNLLPGK
jgi:Uma2 family endonuclease